MSARMPSDDEIRERVAALAAAWGRPMADLTEGFKRLAEAARRASCSFAEMQAARETGAVAPAEGEGR